MPDDRLIAFTARQLTLAWRIKALVYGLLGCSVLSLALAVWRYVHAACP